MKKKRLVGLGTGLLMFGMTGMAHAKIINWTDWTSASTGTPGSATGTMSFAGGQVVNISYTGDVRWAQTSGGTNWWTEGTPKPYTGNSVVDNAPPASDIIVIGMTSEVNTLSFSTPLVNPVMAFVSIGQPGYRVDYAFDKPFTLLSEGAGWWGDGSWSKTGNTLTAYEAHGVIQFDGTLSSISWINTVPENWHGFTIGATQPVPIPATMVLLGTGITGLASTRIRNKKKQ